ncbi:MAG: L,D-transpeptidase family protein [Alphaproteobacteria bacterium]|nr:L,D-transpeptidase family protein [Alphaproteobacteria bacterium]
MSLILVQRSLTIQSLCCAMARRRRTGMQREGKPRTMSDSTVDRRSFCAAAGALMAVMATPGCALAASAPAAAPGPAVGINPVIGRMRRHIAVKNDTLIDLARQYNLGFTELVATNRGVDPWIPGEGTEIILPGEHVLPDGPREGLVLNISDQRIYYFPRGGGATESYPVGTGRDAWGTPRGKTAIVRKKFLPSWYPPKSIRKEDPTLPAVVRPGPDNPLGRHAMYLGWSGYLIHGTNRPYGVGRRVSHGCVRLYPEDIAQLFPRIKIGLPVAVVAQEAKIGRRDGELVLEIHPNPVQSDELEAGDPMTPAKIAELAYKVTAAAGEHAHRIDWDAVHRAEAERAGVPVPILKPGEAASSEG